MASNGVDGSDAGRGGVAACEGAFLLQSQHPSRSHKCPLTSPARTRWHGHAVPWLMCLDELHGGAGGPYSGVKLEPRCGHHRTQNNMFFHICLIVTCTCS